MNVVEHYDLLIEEGNDSYRDLPPLREYMEKWDGKEFIASMHLSGKEKVLEIGVGTGRVAAKVIPLCFSFDGIDISPKTIERANENLSDYQNKHLICADFLNFQFDETYDVIYATLTLQHFEDKQAFISKASALLNHDGILCLSLDKNQSEFIDMGNRKLRVFPDNPSIVERCMENAGLKLREKYEIAFATILVGSK